MFFSGLCHSAYFELSFFIKLLSSFISEQENTLKAACADRIPITDFAFSHNIWLCFFPSYCLLWYLKIRAGVYKNLAAWLCCS